MLAASENIRKNRFSLMMGGLLGLAIVVLFAWSRTCHGNCDDNPDPHQVYEIFMTTNGVNQTLKYGITSQTDFATKDGNPRPEYQVVALMKLPDFKDKIINYDILYSNIPGRLAAKEMEQKLVNDYVAIFRRMPPLQKLPKPTDF